MASLNHPHVLRGLRLGRGQRRAVPRARVPPGRQPARRARRRVPAQPTPRRRAWGPRRPRGWPTPTPGLRPPRREAGQPPLGRGGAGAHRRLRGRPGPGRGGLDRAGRGHDRHGPLRLARAGPGRRASTAGPTCTRWRSCSTSALTGEVPFVADTTMATLMARVGAPLPRHPALGPLDDVLARAAAPRCGRPSRRRPLAARLEAVAAALPAPRDRSSSLRDLGGRAQAAVPQQADLTVQSPGRPAPRGPAAGRRRREVSTDRPTPSGRSPPRSGSPTAPPTRAPAPVAAGRGWWSPWWWWPPWWRAGIVAASRAKRLHPQPPGALAHRPLAARPRRQAAGGRPLLAGRLGHGPLHHGAGRRRW